MSLFSQATRISHLSAATQSIPPKSAGDSLLSGTTRERRQLTERFYEGCSWLAPLS